MSLRGSRRTQVVVAAVVVAVAVVVTVLVVSPWSDDPSDAPVAESELADFSTRGSLAGDGDLVEAAADAWRSGDSLNVRTKPANAMELLWAGAVEAERVADVYVEDGEPETVAIVVLRSGDELATFAVERDGGDVEDVNGLGIRDLGTFPGPAVALAGNLVLVADGQPESLEAAAPDGSTATVTPDAGFIVSTDRDTSLALRLNDASTEAGAPEPGVYAGGQVFVVDPADVDRIWQLLTDPERAESTRSALAESVRPPSQQGDNRLEQPVVGIVAELTSPDGSPVLVLDTAGIGAPWVRTVVAVETRLGPEPRPTVVTLGRADDQFAWVGSAWVTSDDAAPYLVVAGGEDVVRAEVLAGSVSAQVQGAGIVAPPVTGTDNDLPDVVVAGFTESGQVVAAMPQD